MTARLLALLAAFTLASASAQQPPKPKAEEPPAKKDEKSQPKNDTQPPKKDEPKKDEPKKDEPKKDEPKKDDKAAKLPPTAVTDGSVMIAGQKIEYKATAGTLPSTDRTGKAKANIFYMAYTRKSGEGANRKLTFCFNGGPGSASAYVHLGFFGPRRVLIHDEGLTAPSPVQLIENESSILDVTDLVFIDPVSTGYSRAENASEANLFHGLEEDTQSVGEFIRDYVAKNDRTKSPVYIAGESYGTTRAASLSSYLQNRGGVKVAGIVLISSVLNFQTILFGAGNDMPYSLFLPTYAASAFHHGKLDKKWATDLPTVLKEAQKYADGPYLEVLNKGNLLTDFERQAAAKQIALLTGLSEEFVLRNDLRVEATRFRGELLRDQQTLIGRYDSRVTAKTGGGGKGGGGGGDPSGALLSPLFTDGMKAYLPDTLNYKTDMRYQLLAPVQPWSYGQTGTNRYANVAPRLRSAMEKDKNLKVLVCSGYCDLATPYAGTNYTFAHMGPRSLMDQVTMVYYDAGHMFYTHEPSRKKFREDLLKFMAPPAAVAVPATIPASTEAK